MKRLFCTIVTSIILALFLCGCAVESPTSREREPGIIDYLTGSEQIKIYKRTKSKIEDIDKTLKERQQGF